MNERIQRYVNELFEDAPKKRRIMEIQEELLSNMNEKYEDLLHQGKNEDEAFSIVVAGIGDIDDLIADVSEVDRQSFAVTAARGNHGSILIAIGVALYIVGVAALIFISEVFGYDDLGVVIMLCIAAAATAIVVYGASMKKKRYKREDDSFVEEYKEKITMSDKMSRLHGAISSSLWTLIVLAYFIISFLTFRWDITWVIFLVGAILQQVVESIIRNRINISGMIWTSALVLYFILSFLTHKWNLTWLIFLAAAAVQQIVRLIMIWREE